MRTPEQKRQNLRLALILASVAAVLLIGFVTKAALFGI
jgi:hypothetical protein